MRVVLATGFAAAIMLAATPAAGATTTVSYFPVGTPPPPGMDFGLLIQGDAASEDASVRLLESPFRFRVGSPSGPGANPAQLSAGSGCSSVSGGVECNEAGSFTITASLGAGNDTLGEASIISPAQNETMKVDGGSGNDTLTGGKGQDILTGGTGDDELRSVDRNDQLFGNDGNDTLIAGSGDDQLQGGPGQDTFSGDEGNDTIDARDGVRDVSVNCGLGNDIAQLDLADGSSRGIGTALFLPAKSIPVSGCETVEFFAVDDGPPARPLGNRLAIRTNGPAIVRVGCPPLARVRCSGRVSVRDPKRPARVLASGAYKISVGAKGHAALQFTSSQRALLRRRGRAVVATQEQGRSHAGPRGAQRILPVS